ncbi:MAG TPA: hypothetical protein VM101_01330 [Flavitalea sp.]|nr:hypothetical protein [Flavitalea sp.]
MRIFLCWLFFLAFSPIFSQKQRSKIDVSEYKGIYFSGKGDTSYLHLLDQAYRMMEPDPVLENLSFLYEPWWNGFVEGPSWNMWWIQNSFGPTYTMLPFMNKAYQTFVYNSQALWFNVIGNGVRNDKNNFVPPKGALVDCASPSIYYGKQGDARVNIHDWGIGFTVAGILLQSELMLIRRDTTEITYYLPLLESAADFIDTRRDPLKNIFLVGAAGNLLAPSYAGSGKQNPDGSYEMSYLAEISVNYIAALNRLIEVEKMVGNHEKVSLYTERREKVKTGLSNFITNEGYFIRSLDKDGTKHGEYGADKHGYFETTPNHDAMAFRIVNDQQAKRIYRKIQSIPLLRRHKLILPNYPSYDDMYDTTGLFSFGTWVNGGHWTTCEARMQIGYYRVNAFDDAKEAFEVILNRAYRFRLDNSLTDFGAKEYQPHLPVNCIYDAWGAPGGFMRGLFEYEYKCDGLMLYPHIPGAIGQLQQHFPVSFGKKKVYITTIGNGKITSVKINNKRTENFTSQYVFLNPENYNEEIYVCIGMGGSLPLPPGSSLNESRNLLIHNDEAFWNIDALREKQDTIQTPKEKIDCLKQVQNFYTLLQQRGLEDTYEGKHAELILRGVQAIYNRRQLKKDKKLVLLPIESQVAADQLYITSIIKQTEGLIHHLEKCNQSGNIKASELAALWQRSY